MPKENRPEMLDPASQSLNEALTLSFKILKGMMILLVLLFLGSGIFTVSQDEVALVVCLGQVVGDAESRIKEPGLHWTWPYPISEVVRIPAKRVHSLEINDFWYHEEEKKSKGPPRPTSVPATLDPELDGYCLTGDMAIFPASATEKEEKYTTANILHSRWLVHYTIGDPYLYLKQPQDPQELLRAVFAHTVVRLTAQCTIDHARSKTEEFTEEIKNQAQKQLDLLETGIALGDVLPRIIPARQTQSAFEAATQAEVEKEQKIEEAKNYRVGLLNKATGEASSIVAEATNYALETQRSTESDANYFTQLLSGFRANPRVFFSRTHNYVLQEIGQQAREIFIVNNDKAQRELRLQFNHHPELMRIKPAKEEGP